MPKSNGKTKTATRAREFLKRTCEMEKNERRMNKEKAERT